MEIVKLGKSGQVSIPRAFMRSLGIEPGATLMAELTDEGEILLRPAGVYPLEIYSEERVAEFLEQDRMSPAESAKLKSKRRRR